MFGDFLLLTPSRHRSRCLVFSKHLPLGLILPCSRNSVRIEQHPRTKAPTLPSKAFLQPSHPRTHWTVLPARPHNLHQQPGYSSIRVSIFPFPGWAQLRRRESISVSTILKIIVNQDQHRYPYYQPIQHISRLLREGDL
jgi:hypothetical protein